jgi:hypothetical protein
LLLQKERVAEKTWPKVTEKYFVFALVTWRTVSLQALLIVFQSSYKDPEIEGE